MDPAELRLKNLIKPEQFPYTSPTGWEYDSGQYEKTMRLAMEIAGYDELRREQAEKRARGEYMGIGLAFFTEGVGAGPRKTMDILGLGMADGIELRVHPTGKAVLRISVQSQGQGHETTYAQIVAHELGIPPEDIDVVHGDTDQTPFGLGTYGSRSTPVSGAAAAVVSRKVKDRARIVAAAALECSPDDLEWELGRWYVKGDKERGKTIQEIALLSHSSLELPEGVEGQLDAQAVYNPPNLTYPYGCYICVVDVDPGTGQVKVRRFIAVDDCGVRINPMIVEGQVHGGLADGVGMALMEVIAFDNDGNCLGGRSWTTCCPPRSSVRTSSWARPSRRLRTIRSAPRASASPPPSARPPAVVNAVIDALNALRRAPRRHAAARRRTCGGPCRGARSRRMAVMAPSAAAREREQRRADGLPSCTPAWCWPNDPPRRSRVTRRWSSPTGRSRGSSAGSARSPPSSGPGAGSRWSRDHARVPARSTRPDRGGERDRQDHRPQPMPVRRHVGDLHRAGAPRATVAVVGDSPIAEALATVGAALGYEVEVVAAGEWHDGCRRRGLARPRGAGLIDAGSTPASRTSGSSPPASAARR